jgi:quinoprotein glucose dehydrogenase
MQVSKTFLTALICATIPSFAAPAPAPEAAPKPALTFAEKAAKQTAKKEAEKAEAAKAAAAKPAAAPAAPTTQQILHPDYAPAFEEATKAIAGFKPASGLKVEVFAAEPQLQNPVALSMDDRGRAWVVETFRFDGGGEGNGVYDIRHRYHLLDEDLASKTVEQRLETIKKWNNNDLSSLSQWPDRVRLIEDKDGDGKADSSSIFADDFAHPLDGVGSGVITRRREDGGDDVYFANIPDLWLLRDKNKDGKADFKESLSTGYGVRYSLLGHDLHGLRWGPDGRLYFSNGDRGMHVTTKEGVVLDYPDEGTVMRCDPDGSNLEVFHRGLRNPQKLAFDEYGNLFTGDNNCDYGDPARWVYLVEGGDTGWRIGYQHIQTPRPTGPWKGEVLYALPDENKVAYVIPPIDHIASGPSGCTYYPGTGLPDSYKGHFFLTDFRGGPSSAVHSFALKQKGAGFEMVDKGVLITGIVPTDIDFGPAGGAYITDWIGGFPKTQKGRIFRVFSPEVAETPLVKETKKLLNEGMSKRDAAELQKLLAHADMRVRQAAQFELASRGEKSGAVFLETATKSDSQLARIHAIWGLGQLSRASTSPKVLSPIVPLLEDKDDEIRAQAVKVLGEARVEEAFEPILKLTSDKNLRVQYFAALSAGRYHRSPALPSLMGVLERNNNKDPFLRHAAVMGLYWVNDSSLGAPALHHKSAAVRMGLLLVQRRQQNPEIKQFLKDSDIAVAVEAARAINDVPIDDARGALAAMLNAPVPTTQPATVASTQPAPQWPEPMVHRALNANFRIGGAENAKAVAEFAAKSDASDVMRIEAMQMLAEWDKPRGIDRVVGVWRPVPPRDAGLAKAACAPVLAKIVTAGPENVRIAAIDLLKKVGTTDANLLFGVVTTKDTPPEVSAAALGAMESLNDARMNEAVDWGIKNGKGALRTAAIKQMVRRPDGLTRLQTVLSEGSVTDQQAILSTLGSIENSQPADQVLMTWMDKLLAGQVAPELQLDLLESAGSSKSDAIKEKLKAFEAKRTKDDPLAAYRESLVGGEPQLGRKIFFERADVSCLRCHKIGGEGGVAGPDLTGVAGRKDRNYLLESIIDPNKQIAPGFEAVTLKVKAGTKYTGVVKADDEKEVVLDAGDGAVVHVAKPEIASRTKGLSPMPQDISKPLSKRDLRNLVEFLASLKEPSTKPAAAAQQAARTQ